MTAVPLPRLRVMPPQGAPVVHPKYGRGVLLDPSDAECPAIFEEYANVRWGRPCLPNNPGISLDLTAPTTSRIDGATVAATMLAEAAGLDVSGGVTWRVVMGAENMHRVIVADLRSDCHTFIAKTDATDPRDILAAVLLAVLGAP